MSSKTRKSQSVSDTIANSELRNAQEVNTMSDQSNTNSVVSSDPTAQFVAGTDEMIAQAVETTNEIDDTTAPTADESKKVFNVYRSTLPGSEGKIFTALYYNPLHTYMPEGVKDEKVVRLYTNRTPVWREARHWLSAISDYTNGKFSQVDPAGFMFRLNGNLVIKADLLRELAHMTRTQGIWKLEGVKDQDLTLTGLRALREDMIWIEFKEMDTNLYSFYSVANGYQVEYYSRVAKLAAGWNVYFRKLDSKFRMPLARLSQMTEKTRQQYTNAAGEYFFKQPLIEYYCGLMSASSYEEARQIASDHINASKQRRAISANAARTVNEAEENGEQLQSEGLKLFLRDASKCTSPDLVEKDDKGRAFVNPMRLTKTTRLYGYNAAGLPVVQTAWMVLDGQDSEKLNAVAIAKIRGANGVVWMF